MDTIGGDPGASLFSGDLAARLDAFDQLVVKAGVRFPPLGKLLAACPLNGRGVLLALFALLLLLIVPTLTLRLLRRFRMVTPNFRGEVIPNAAGLAVVFYAVFSLLAAGYLLPVFQPEMTTWLIAIIGFGTLGFLDDTRGSREIRGLRGHFRAAFRERTITTGFVKAVGGGLLAMLLGGARFP